MPKITQQAKQEKEQIKEGPKVQNPEFGFEKVGLEYINFMRNSFRTWMESIALMQGQGERLLETVLKQGQAGYDEGGKTIREWANNSKRAREQFQGTVEENLAKLEKLLSKKE